MKKLLIIAIALRLIVASFLFHPDIKTFNFQSSFLKKGVFNIYSYLIENRKTLPVKEEFVYFPLTYFVLGGYQAVASPILGKGFDSWLSEAGSENMVANPSIFKYLLILKLPYLILDVAIAFLLLQFFKDKKQGQKAMAIWLFNPFTIFIIYAFGNIDIFPVILTLLSLLLVRKGRLNLAALSLGIAAGFKLYPLLFVPFLLLKGENFTKKAILAAIPFAVFALISAPFVSNAFIQSTLISGLTTRIFNPGFTVGFGESIIVGLFLLTILFIHAWLIDKKPNLFSYWTATLLIIFSFSHFHIAWLLWIAPFVVILAIRKAKLSWLIFLLASAATVIPLLYQDRSMTISLYRTFSTWFDLLPTPFNAIQRFYDPYNLQSILHTVFAAGAMFTSYLLLRKEKEA